MAEQNGTGRKKGRGKTEEPAPLTPQTIDTQKENSVEPGVNHLPAPADAVGNPEVPQVARPSGILPAIPVFGSTDSSHVAHDETLSGSSSLTPTSPGESQNQQDPQATPAPAGLMEDPVEILVGLAERGEIDPWNIDIIEVTDRFLSELERRRELNLQLSGRTLFYAATLLRMKSEQLDQSTGEDEVGEDGDEGFGEDFDLALDSDVAYEGRLGPIERLEHEIQRRLDRKTQRKSPITLFELITELKNIEKEERRRRRMASDPAEVYLIDADDVVGIAHEEGFQESSMTRLAEYLEGLEIDEEMTLRELCTRMEWNVPEVYIPLLFLALDGRCSLRQEEFFGDIWVQIRHPDEAEPPAGSLAE
ncbi:segregation/condensation protein A [Methanoregula sp.]|jgi:segregation and condensation protein A|uniref:segregation/condensation protein A n=1 Tax=Methanoregula sp. TaxID=2052170 RepID=UPI003C1C27CB